MDCGGTSTSTCSVVAGADGNEQEGRAVKPPVKWTAELDAELINLWKQHYSGSKIAEHLRTLGYDLTRNAVIGRANRIMNGKRPPIEPRGSGFLPPGIKRIPPHRRTSTVRPKVSRPMNVPRCEDINSLHLTLDQLERNHCRWPSGDGPFTFCGHTKFTGSYCASHYFASIEAGR